jgi:hypothetical protein
MSRLFLSALLALLLSGCGNLAGLRLLAPETHGLESVSPSLYVETGTDIETRRRLLEDIDRAEHVVEAAYGGLQSHPVVHVCITESCYAKFGGHGSRAKVYGGRLILISPRGSNWHYIAHEWSHAELYSRLTLAALWSLPQWFDEGIAVAISEAPENSEAHWTFLVEAGIPRPTRETLYSFKSLSQWDAAVGQYGEKQNQERKARGQTEVRPVYTAAGHELRPWLAAMGRKGLLKLIAELNAGADFASLYVSRSDPATW